MSYNTRRTQAAPGSRGPQTTQVNYHQQPARTPASAQSRNPGYSSTPNYNSSAQPAYQTQQPQGYSTSAPPPPTKPAPTPPAPAQAPAPAPAQVQPPLPTQPPPPSTPIATPKQEPLTPADTPMSEASENGGSPVKQPYWKRNKITKVPGKVKKMRMNAKMRKLLNPKNAIIFLNELRPGMPPKFNTVEESGWGCSVMVDIDGKVFTGHGVTAAKARLIAAEEALKHILLEKLAKGPSPPTPTATPTPDTKKDQDGDESMDTDAKDTKPSFKAEEDDMPWGSLAAFALHKLFAEWQDEGDNIAPDADKFDEEGLGNEELFMRRQGPPPEFRFPQRQFTPGGGPPARFMRGRGRGRPGFNPYYRGHPGRFMPPHRPPPTASGPFPPVQIGANLQAALAVPKAAPIGNMHPMKRMPDDANKRHPVMLLNQLRPNIVYHETKEGVAPYVEFFISVMVDNKEYVGRGKTKKEAKKNCAKAALTPLGIQYDD